MESQSFDGCETSNDMYEIVGMLAPKNNTYSSDSSLLDDDLAFKACTDADSDSILSSDVNRFLASGLTIVSESQSEMTYLAMVKPKKLRTGYFLVTCYYRDVLIEGSSRLIASVKSN
jgi:hypothetical protein